MTMTNRRHSRRGFMSLTGAGIAGVFGCPGSGAAADAGAQDADLVVFNAKVYTVDSRAPKAEAFAVKAGRFAAVGSNSEIKPLIGKRTQTFDARQMTIVPGFIDSAQCHILFAGAGTASLVGRTPGSARDALVPLFFPLNSLPPPDRTSAARGSIRLPAGRR